MFNRDANGINLPLKYDGRKSVKGTTLWESKTRNGRRVEVEIPQICEKSGSALPPALIKIELSRDEAPLLLPCQFVLWFVVFVLSCLALCALEKVRCLLRDGPI